MKKKCAQCGDFFSPRSNNARFCGTECRDLFHILNMKKKRRSLYHDLNLFKIGKLSWAVLKRRIGNNASLMKTLRSRLTYDL